MANINYSGPSEFVHLHCHTVYSTLDGVQTPEQMFEVCAERGWPAIAVTEHGVLSSVPDNYFAAKSKGVKYIAGCEIYFNDYEPLRQEMAAAGKKVSQLKVDDPDLYSRIMRNRHLTVLAKNMTGFHNLVKMATEAYEFGFYSRPRIWFDKLLEYKEGLIILSGCFNGPVSHEANLGLLRTKDHHGALDYAMKFKEAFGDDYYIEVQMPCIDEKGMDDRKAFWLLHKIADKAGIETVLTNDAHYIDRKDFEVQKLMMAISQDLTIDSPDLFHVNSSEQFLKTRAELYHTFKTKGYCRYVTDEQFERSCDNTISIAEKCEPFELDSDPKIPTHPGDADKLKKLVLEELMKRGLHKCEKTYVIDNKEVTYLEQIKIELNRFIEKGFASYFLITRELIQYMLDNGWPFGPRGCTVSGAQINTPDGLVVIEDAEVGDRVLDGFGDEQLIDNKFIYDVDEDLFVFELFDGRILELTCDHKLYTLRGDDILLLRASEIKDTDKIIDTSEAPCPNLSKSAIDAKNVVDPIQLPPRR